MHHYVKKLQSKPEPVRKQILVAALALSMFIVGSVWIYDLAGPKPQQQAQSDTTTKPFALFKNSITSAYENISASVGNIKKDTVVEQDKQIDLIPVEHTQ
jgi:hypothetical protein